MKYILTGITVLFSFLGQSQSKQYVYYFDQDLNSAAESKSSFKGIGVFHHGALEFKLYDRHTNNLLATEHYTDSSLKIQNGLFQSFYSNGAVAIQGGYIKGLQNGLWMQWDSAGHIIDSTVYSNNKKMLEIHKGYYSNGKLDSLVVNDIKTDHLDKTFYDDTGRLISEFSFIGQNGIIKRYDSTMRVTIDTATSRIETKASFPGGDAAWTRYIVNEIQRNADALHDGAVSGTCTVRFIVGKDGTISSAEPLTMKGTKLASIAVNIISNGPKWKPASQYGRYVNASREQPITFKVVN
jgi:antitoxin component YwqK of YwqJK toxin-antitoxin module